MTFRKSGRADDVLIFTCNLEFMIKMDKNDVDLVSMTYFFISEDRTFEFSLSLDKEIHRT